MVTKWKEDGFTEEVKPVDLGSKSAIREEFSKDVHGRSVSSIKNYWQRQIFSGKGVPPPELDSEDAVVNFVRTNRGAIGYVSKKADLEGVKVLPLDGDGDE